GSPGIPERVPSAPAWSRRRAATAPPESRRCWPTTTTRTGGQRRETARFPSELLAPDEMAHDQHDREAGEDHGQDQEEGRRRAGELGGVAAEAIYRVDVRLLTGRAVLPDPQQQAERDHNRETPEPGEVEPAHLPGGGTLHRELVCVQVVVGGLRLGGRVPARH